MSKMIEMFTTPRECEVNIVAEVLRENNIRFLRKECDTEYGWRYCIYVQESDSDFAYQIIDGRLSENGM